MSIFRMMKNLLYLTDKKVLFAELERFGKLEKGIRIIN